MLSGSDNDPRPARPGWKSEGPTFTHIKKQENLNPRGGTTAAPPTRREGGQRHLRNESNTPHATRHPTRRLEDSSTTQERIAAPRQKKGEEAPLPEKEEGEHHLSNAEREATLLQKRKVTTPPKNRDETGFHNLGGEKPRPRPRRERPPPPPDAGGETTITP